MIIKFNIVYNITKERQRTLSTSLLVNHLQIDIVCVDTNLPPKSARVKLWCG